MLGAPYVVEYRHVDLSVLFADVSGSTGLYEAFGDETGRHLVVECLEVLKTGVKQCLGTVVECVGDELLATFPDAAGAARASCELHRAIEAANQGLPVRMAIRIGYHHGPVAVDGGRLFGDTIHVARRVASLAKAQQTLTTRQAIDRMDAPESLTIRFVDRTHLKGKADPFELFEIVWDEGAATGKDTAVGIEETRPRPAQQLLLDTGEKTWRLDATHPAITLGRDRAADVVFEHGRVSRLHATIEYRRDRFVFVDQSTNGSQVIELGGERHFVHRDEHPLADEGTIVLGPKGAGARSSSLGYRVLAGEPA